MKRKIIKLGQSTYVASLPSKWIRKLDLKQGDYLEVEEKENTLLIGTEKQAAKKDVTLDLKKINSRLIATFIQSVFMIGYDKMTLLHEPFITEYKTGKKIKTNEFIQSLVNKRFVGAEIIEQKETRTVIMDLGGVTEQTNEQVFNRIIFLIKALTEDCIKAIKENDRAVLQSIAARQDNISRFLMYYQRVLAKTRKEDTLMFGAIAQKISIFKMIAGAYKHIARLALSSKKGYSKEIVDLHEEIVKSLHLVLKTCLEFKTEKAVEFINKREKLWKMIEHLEKKESKMSCDDLLLFGMSNQLMFASYSILKFKFTDHQLGCLLQTS